MRESPIYQEILAEGRAEGLAEGEARGEAKGEAKGEARARQTIAGNMLQSGMSVEMTAQLTGLTIEEVQALRSPQS